MVVILKGRCVIIPEILQRQALEQPNVNHMGIKKLHFSWAGMNNDTENHIKIVLHVLIFSKHNKRKK